MQDRVLGGDEFYDRITENVQAEAQQHDGDGGSVFASSGGSRDPKDAVPPPIVALTPEHYNRIARQAEKKIPTKLEFDIQTEFLKGDTDAFNVVGEIPGGSKKDEIVMPGAHLDSGTAARALPITPQDRPSPSRQCAI